MKRQREVQVAFLATVALSSGGGSEQFTSAKGECTVIIETAEAGHVAGTFKCSDVPGSSGKSADASGTFEATG